MSKCITHQITGNLQVMCEIENFSEARKYSIKRYLQMGGSVVLRLMGSDILLQRSP